MVSNDAEVTEDQLEQEFRADPCSGMQFLDMHFRRNIFAFLKSLSSHFGPHELNDVYQDTMRRMVRATSKPRFDPTKPMRLVLDIARKASIDATKKKKLCPIGSANDFADMVGDEMRGTKVALEWALILKEDMPKVRRAIGEAIEELPPMQRIAATAMMNVYEEIHDTKSWLPLRDEIQRLIGEDVTTDQAFDNWRVARVKIAGKLRRAGFDLLREE